jgi:DnaK suppressor protein
MPAKRAAPKTAKGKKAVSRAPVRKVVARKSEPARARTLATHARKSAAVTSSSAVSARKAHAASASEPVSETKKPLRPATPAAVPAVTSAPRSAGGNEGEDADTLEPGSLLAGPRNVQPYIVKRGEQYMNKEQLEHFRNILNSWKRDLMVEVDRTVSHMKDEAANFPDPNDRATQEEEFSLELRTRDRERKLIRKIDEALKRIEDGSYGYCLETGEEIGVKRLEARPVATLSIEAQERRERRERQYGDRDDRYR